MIEYINKVTYTWIYIEHKTCLISGCFDRFSSIDFSWAAGCKWNFCLVSQIALLEIKFRILMFWNDYLTYDLSYSLIAFWSTLVPPTRYRGRVYVRLNVYVYISERAKISLIFLRTSIYFILHRLIRNVIWKDYNNNFKWAFGGYFEFL